MHFSEEETSACMLYDDRDFVLSIAMSPALISMPGIHRQEFNKHVWKRGVGGRTIPKEAKYNKKHRKRRKRERDSNLLSACYRPSTRLAPFIFYSSKPSAGGIMISTL